jgi:hypothetical protein
MALNFILWITLVPNKATFGQFDIDVLLTYVFSVIYVFY